MFDEYYSSMDRTYGKLVPNDAPKGRDGIVEVSDLTPMEVGTSTNPMENAVTALNARIRHGASKIEIGFMGTGKSNSQRPSPEAFGKQDREDIRALTEINKIKTSVHAALHGDSLAGFNPQQGFSDANRQVMLKEIERAIQFSAEATKGGAIVFHTGEWYRPISNLPGAAGTGFQGYPGESDNSPVFIVTDTRTGAVGNIRRDHRVQEPDFHTAESYQKVLGKTLVGTKDPTTGLTIEKDDWVDIDGNVIKREWFASKKDSEVQKLFNRLPIWDSTTRDFNIKPKTFTDFENEAAMLSKKTGEKISGEELFYKSQMASQASQYLGLSKRHGEQYDELLENRGHVKKALEFYNQLEKTMPESEKWKIMEQKGVMRGLEKFVPSKSVLPSVALKDALNQIDDSLKQVHETGSSYQAQARDFMDKMQHVSDIESFGLKKTADTIGTAGLKAWQYTQDHKKELDEAIFAAPENYDLQNYGSHPDEMRKIINESRAKMAEMLKANYGKSDEEAKKLAATHIRATVDIGHFNMWKQHFQAKPGESLEARNKRFDKWAVDELGKLAKEGLIGHVHVADNMGFDDEHLTPGQGNAPIKDFMKKMSENGIKDFIVEQGSYNIFTALPDTWALLGSPVYGVGAPTRTWRSFHQQHMGYHNPAQYIVGAYAPSNEWKLWSEVPFE